MGIVASIDEKALKRFWSKVDKSTGNNGCWHWKGFINPSGYGTFWLNGKMPLAHRISYALKNGDDPNDLCVLHTCDVRRCVNPNHLWLGTRLDNTRDMDKKGRRVKVFGKATGAYTKPEQRRKGETHGCHKLTEAQVLEIRKLASQQIPQRKIAKIYNITQTQVHNIVAKKTWKHI